MSFNIVFDNMSLSTYLFVPSDCWRCLHLRKQRIGKIVYVQGRLVSFHPVGMVAKGVNSHALEIRISGEPFFRPIKPRIIPLVPSLTRSTSKPMYEDHVGKRLDGVYEETQTFRPVDFLVALLAILSDRQATENSRQACQPPTDFRRLVGIPSRGIICFILHVPWSISVFSN